VQEDKVEIDISVFPVFFFQRSFDVAPTLSPILFHWQWFHYFLFASFATCS